MVPMGFSFEEKRFEDRLGGVLREEGSGAMCRKGSLLVPALQEVSGLGRASLRSVAHPVRGTWCSRARDGHRTLRPNCVLESGERPGGLEWSRPETFVGDHVP